MNEQLIYVLIISVDCSFGYTPFSITVGYLTIPRSNNVTRAQQKLKLLL
jgi:hypothetical protein